MSELSDLQAEFRKGLSDPTWAESSWLDGERGTWRLKGYFDADHRDRVEQICWRAGLAVERHLKTGNARDPFNLFLDFVFVNARRDQVTEWTADDSYYRSIKRLATAADRALGELVLKECSTSAPERERTPDKKTDNEGNLPRNVVNALAREINASKSKKTVVTRSFVAANFSNLSKEEQERKVQSLLRELRRDRWGRLLKQKNKADKAR